MYRIINGEVLTAHMLNLEDIYCDFNLDLTRLFNLYGTGMTPSKDCHGTSNRNAIMKGTTLSSERNAVLPLWIFKGKRLPFRVSILPDSSPKTDFAGSLLPPESLLTTRPKVGGMDDRILCCGVKSS
eukprot:IDg19720t1